MRRNTVWLGLLLGLASCDLLRDAPSDANDTDAALRPPRTDLVPAVGSADTLDIACWNIENFPATNLTPSTVADLITSLDLDIVVVEEIASVDAFDQLVRRLRDYDGVLSTHHYATGDYQKIGVLTRRATVTVGTVTELFANDSAFPRPALSVPIVFDDGVHAMMAFEVMGLHLKAGTQPSDIGRRTEAVATIDAHLQAQIADGGQAKVVVLGDYNTVLGDGKGNAIMAPLLDHPERYDVRSQALALAGIVTFLPSGVMLDQLTTTVGFDAAITGATTIVPPLDEQYPGYEAGVSDHLPIVLRVALD